MPETGTSDAPADTRPARPPATQLRVSVCITCHNYGRFLDESIRSALDQTHRYVEVIVVDDGSTDDSRDVAAKYADRVHVVFHERKGQAAAAAAAAELATGDVIVFLDADDLLEPRICERVAATFAANPELVLVQWRLRTIDADGNPTGSVRPPRRGLQPSGDLRRHVLRIRSWHSQVTSGVAYATWAVRRVLPARLPPGERGGFDRWLTELVPLLGPIRSLDEVGGCYRRHGRNLSGSYTNVATWARRMIGVTEASHAGVHALATELGLECPADATELRDPSFLGWRLVSVALEPDRHPLPRDSRLRLAFAGVLASALHPHFPLRHRLRRSVWFLACGLAPRAALGSVLAWYVPDCELDRETVRRAVRDHAASLARA